MIWAVLSVLGLGAGAWFVGESRGAIREVKSTVTWPVAVVLCVGLWALTRKGRR
jgi:uncharacterized membrane protein required for colicin V production